MNRPTLHDSRAVLVGAWTYRDPRLPEVPAARNSLTQMHELLTSDICGWPASNVLTVSDPAVLGDLPDQLVQRFGEATEVALFYFVGHGQLDESLQLCLCLGRSVTSNYRLRATSLMYDSVRHALLSSPARIKIVILDCCYSGMAASPHTLSGSTDLAELAVANGVYIMAASGPHGVAYAETPGDDPQPMTYFTRNFVEVLHEGISGQPEYLRLSPIFQEVRARLLGATKPEPTRRATNTADDFVFARNLVAPTLQRDPEAENAQLRDQLSALRAELDSARQERQQLTDQLTSMLGRLGAPPQQTEKVADELRKADSKVQAAEKQVRQLKRVVDLPESLPSGAPASLGISRATWRSAATLVLAGVLSFPALPLVEGLHQMGGTTPAVTYSGINTLAAEVMFAFGPTEAGVTHEADVADIAVKDGATTGASRQLWFSSPAVRVDAVVDRPTDCATSMAGASKGMKGYYLAVGEDRMRVCVRPRIGGYALVLVNPVDVTVDGGSFGLTYDYVP
ncbi:caspase family protein [Actinoplanes sp. NBC_00393]|uniref:caspase, EACC1-associated type n=1 Tax=Actinoplanes sp. NBC_00393 TaxID=2975953 RepID=UPI002E232B09